MKKILVILGPTATGKTDLALFLARKFQGELISADSRQVYKGLDIGTGKYPNKKVKVKKKKNNWEIDGGKIWMYDVVSPKIQYSVADYVLDANKIINDIIARDKLPIIVGGTGLYIKALIDGLSNLAVPVDINLRKKLDKLSLTQLQNKLQNLSPEKYKYINNSDIKNPRRLIRKIELFFTSEESLRATVRGGLSKNLNFLKIGLTAPREVLYKCVDQRVLSRISQGMIEEAKLLHKKGLTLQRMRELGLEYGVLADYLESKFKTQDELVKVMQGKIHSFVRRQQTWFKTEQNIFWFDILDLNYIEKVENRVYTWYYQSNDAKN